MINMCLVLQRGSDENKAATKIWFIGNVDGNYSCPLKECAKAKKRYAASDMYHLERHFHQVHKVEYPNPLLIFECPVEECEAKKLSMLKMRQHLEEEHDDLYGVKAATKSASQAGGAPLNGSMQKAEKEEQEEKEGAEDGEKESRG